MIMSMQYIYIYTMVYKFTNKMFIYVHLIENMMIKWWDFANIFRQTQLPAVPVQMQPPLPIH